VDLPKQNRWWLLKGYFYRPAAFSDAQSTAAKQLKWSAHIHTKENDSSQESTNRNADPSVLFFR